MRTGFTARGERSGLAFVSCKGDDKDAQLIAGIAAAPIADVPASLTNSLLVMSFEI